MVDHLTIGVLTTQIFARVNALVIITCHAQRAFRATLTLWSAEWRNSHVARVTFAFSIGWGISRASCVLTAWVRVTWVIMH